MHVDKLRVSAQTQGLVPAGRYFAKLAQSLRDANAAEHARQEKGASLQRGFGGAVQRDAMH